MLLTVSIAYNLNDKVDFMIIYSCKSVYTEMHKCTFELLGKSVILSSSEILYGFVVE